MRQILDHFKLATGLQINFTKITFIPIYVTEEIAQTIAANLGTQVHSFPQTYLGLPLSPIKLPSSVFQTLLDRIDTYLAGWRAALLSKGW
jgi:hypothetical protein